MEIKLLYELKKKKKKEKKKKKKQPETKIRLALRISSEFISEVIALLLRSFAV